MYSCICRATTTGKRVCRGPGCVLPLGSVAHTDGRYWTAKFGRSDAEFRALVCQQYIDGFDWVLKCERQRVTRRVPRFKISSSPPLPLLLQVLPARGSSMGLVFPVSLCAVSLRLPCRQCCTATAHSFPDQGSTPASAAPAARGHTTQIAFAAATSVPQRHAASPERCAVPDQRRC